MMYATSPCTTAARASSTRTGRLRCSYGFGREWDGRWVAKPLARSQCPQKARWTVLTPAPFVCVEAPAVVQIYDQALRPAFGVGASTPTRDAVRVHGVVGHMLLDAALRAP
jgi:hypothetical protein